MQNRPSAAELIEAVREFLQQAVTPQLSGHTAFHAKVAINVLAIVQRELELGPAQAAEERHRLADFLGHDGDLSALNRDLVVAVRQGRYDDRQAALVKLLQQVIEGKLKIDNPRYARD